MRTPEFWYPVHGRFSGPLPWLLAPFSMCYMFAGYARSALTRPFRAPVGVVCVGNLTAGGTGKTPVAMAVAKRLLERGVNVHFLTRGFGGAIAGPVRVEPARHSAHDVGDEALLLAKVAPTWVARNRKAGAIAVCAAGAQMLLLDDGHQNPQLIKDLSLVLIDAQRGFGNGWVMPAGPLREPVQRGLSRADAVLLIGEGSHIPASGKPQLSVHRSLCDPDALRGKTIHAFCGIGAPQQFFEMLRNAGALLVDAQVFDDHHPFTDQEIEMIVSSARKSGATPVTTQKDWVRLSPAQQKLITAIGMEIQFDDEPALARLLESVIHRPT